MDTANVSQVLKDMGVNPGTIEALPIEPGVKYILVCDGRNIQAATGQRLVSYMKKQWGIEAVSLQIPSSPNGKIAVFRVDDIGDSAFEVPPGKEEKPS